MAIVNASNSSTTLGAAFREKKAQTFQPKRRRKVKAKKGDSLTKIAADRNLDFNSVADANRGITTTSAGMTINLPTTPIGPSLSGSYLRPTRTFNPRTGQTGGPKEPFSINFPKITQEQPERFGDRAFDILGDNPSGTGIAGSTVSELIASGEVVPPANRFVARAGELLGPEYAGLTFENSQEGLQPSGLTEEARRFAGSQFGEDRLTSDYLFAGDNVNEGVRRQGVLDILARVENDIVQNRISGLAVSALFSEIEASDNPAKLYDKLAGNYEVDVFGNLVRIGTANTLNDGSTSGGGGFGSFGRGRGGGGGGTGRTGRTGQNINTSMLTWRIATG